MASTCSVSLLRLPEPLHQGLVLVLEDSVENSSNGLIFMKKRAKKRALFQLKNGRKTGEIRIFLEKKREL